MTRKCTNLYPESALSSELLPAPEGPMIATSCPEVNLPWTPFTTTFLGPVTKKYVDYDLSFLTTKNGGGSYFDPYISYFFFIVVFFCV